MNEFKSIKAFSPKQILSSPLHQEIVDRIMRLSVISIFNSNVDRQGLFNLDLKRLEKIDDIDSYESIIEDLKPEINLSTNTLTFVVSFSKGIDDKSRLYYNAEINLKDIISLFTTQGEIVDAYGGLYKKIPIFTGSEDQLNKKESFKHFHVLNNYDHDVIEKYISDCNDIHWLTVLVLTTIYDDVVRYTHIVYSLKYQKLIIRDDVCYQLPFIVDNKNYFGNKRGVYRQHSNLSIRTCMNVYNKVDKQYHQPDEAKNTLSYPRLILY